MNGMIAVNTMHTDDRRKDNRGYAESMNREQVDSLLSEDWLRRMIGEIRGGNEALKDKLPYICPHYARFRNNHRAQADIIPEAFTFMTCVDVDDKELVDKAIKRALELNEDEYSDWQDQVLRIEYSARKKVHIYIRIPKGMTIEEAQQAFCKEIDVPYDESCITPERFIYVTGRDEEVYRSLHWLEPLADEEIAERREAYLERGLDVDGRPLKNVALKVQAKPTAQKDSGLPTECVKPASLTAFDLCAEQAGLDSKSMDVWGEHNWHTNLMAVLSVGVAKLMSRQQLHAVVAERLPNYSQTEDCKKLIDYFYDKYDADKGFMNTSLREINAKAQRKASATDEAEDASHPKSGESEWASRGLGKLLPIGLKETLTGVPASMHMPVLCSVLPLAAAYADQVEVRYCDGEMQKLGLMSIIYGEQASGKSVCKHAVNIWKRQFDEEDALARKREDEWKERKKSRKANEKAPEDPKVLIRVVPVTVSCSTLLKRLKNANGHSLYSFGEELDTLRKTNGAGSWSSKYDIYRLAFDPIDSEWGQDYNSDQAESGVVKVAYNWSMLGTSGAVRKCFKSDNVENGLSSRILLAEMPDTSFAKMPRYGQRSAEDEAKIQEAVTRLRSYSGYVDTPRLRKAIDRWVEEQRVVALKDIDHVKDIYRRRAAVIGFRCGVIFHLLSLPSVLSEGKGSGETKACVKFALMMADYCLNQQIKVFGNVLMNQYVDAETECQRYGENNSIFDQLPPTFTADDLAALKPGKVSRNSIIKIISRWNRDGWVVKVGTRFWSKKSDNDKVTS